LCLTPWQELELANTFRLGIQRAERRKLPIRYQPANCLKRVQEDLHDGILKRVDLDWTACVRRASQLSHTHTETLGIVMLDIWHIACALEVGADTFWTFDEDQRKLALATRHFKAVIGLNP
jgi:predicted nucleic acid-binding protein